MCVPEKRLPFEIKICPGGWNLNFLVPQGAHFCVILTEQIQLIGNVSIKSRRRRELRILGLIRELKQSNSNV